MAVTGFIKSGAGVFGRRGVSGLGFEGLWFTVLKLTVARVRKMDLAIRKMILSLLVVSITARILGRLEYNFRTNKD